MSLATQLLGINSGCKPITLDPYPRLINQAGSAEALTGGWLYFSDSPEQVTSQNGVADKGHWLMNAQVTGRGQVFLWHQNSTGRMAPLNTALVIYNPNFYPITITASHYGLTNNLFGEGVSAWLDYFRGRSTSVTVSANGWGNLFSQSVPNNYIWGVVAYLNITNPSGEPATAVLMDLAWINNSSGATTFADSQGTEFRRGIGDGYSAPISVNPICLTDVVASGKSGISFNVAATMDSFGGKDIPYVTDPSGAASGWLEGNYGVKMEMSIPVTSNDHYTYTIRLFVGNPGTCPVLVAMNGSGGPGGCSTKWLAGHQYLDLIEDTITPSTNKTYNFQLVCPGCSCAPINVGVRVIRTRRTSRSAQKLAVPE